MKPVLNNDECMAGGLSADCAYSIWNIGELFI